MNTSNTFSITYLSREVISDLGGSVVASSVSRYFDGMTVYSFSLGSLSFSLTVQRGVVCGAVLHENGELFDACTGYAHLHNEVALAFSLQFSGVAFSKKILKRALSKFRYYVRMVLGMCFSYSDDLASGVSYHFAYREQDCFEASDEQKSRAYLSGEIEFWHITARYYVS